MAHERSNLPRTAGFAKGKNDLNIAAFLLHQATERLYHCMLLTFTLYSPASHNLNFLRPRAETLDLSLVDAWPRGTRSERRRFDLIRRAYVEARYSPHYVITPDELAWAAERIAVLRDLVKAACEKRLAAAKGRIEEEIGMNAAAALT